MCIDALIYWTLMTVDQQALAVHLLALQNTFERFHFRVVAIRYGYDAIVMTMRQISRTPRSREILQPIRTEP
jgi:DNA-binding PucR family transcriptional regulator